MKKFVAGLIGCIGLTVVIAGCQHKGYPGRCGGAPAQQVPTYSPSHQGSDAASPSYAPAQNYESPAGSGTRAAPSYQGSGSR